LPEKGLAARRRGAVAETRKELRPFAVGLPKSHQRFDHAAKLKLERKGQTDRDAMLPQPMPDLGKSCGVEIRTLLFGPAEQRKRFRTKLAYLVRSSTFREIREPAGVNRLTLFWRPSSDLSNFRIIAYFSVKSEFFALRLIIRRV
jgi:hypothetical protein